MYIIIDGNIGSGKTGKIKTWERLLTDRGQKNVNFVVEPVGIKHISISQPFYISFIT